MGVRLEIVGRLWLDFEVVAFEARRFSNRRGTWHPSFCKTGLPFRSSQNVQHDSEGNPLAGQSWRHGIAAHGRPFFAKLGADEEVFQKQAAALKCGASLSKKTA